MISFGGEIFSSLNVLILIFCFLLALALCGKEIFLLIFWTGKRFGHFCRFLFLETFSQDTGKEFVLVTFLFVDRC